MSKFSYEEKIRTVLLVEEGESFSSVSRQTGISRQVINFRLYCRTRSY